MQFSSRSGRRAAVAAVAVVASTGVVLAGCSANPGPPPLENEVAAPVAGAPASSTSASAPDPQGRTRINVGVDALRNGFNPHLLADSTDFVAELAALVLPSAFRGDELNSDLLVSAEEIEPSAPPVAAGEGEGEEGDAGDVVASVRYVISPEAQWSDGTPVSATDFEYLWRSMITTPGVIDAAGYQAISAVRGSGGGKTVTVDFTRRVADWHELFSNLLPAHLAQTATFATALQDTIPASAGKFLVAQVDRSRAIVELNRNDRFWGESPARVEILTFSEVRDQVTGSDQLRTGQLSFVDTTPTQTLEQALSLVPGTQTRTVSSGRQLVLTLNATADATADPQARQALLSLIDVPAIARLAAGRDANLSVPEVASVAADARDEAAARWTAATVAQPLRIAADPADPEAAAAVRAIVDSLARLGVRAESVSADFATLATEALPAGTVDAVVGWGEANPDALGVASFYGCAAADTADTTEAAEAALEQATSPAEGQSARSEDEDAPRGSNLSGYCAPEAQAALDVLVSGTGTGDSATDPATVAAEIERTAQLRLPLLNETRLQVLGRGIVGPDAMLADWPQGIPTADTWQAASTPAAASAAPFAAAEPE